MALYGFFDTAERDWFKLLTTVQGVGAKVGLSILSAVPADKLQLAIASGDKASVQRADGVGAKLALRIVTELKDKAGSIGVTFEPTPRGNASEPVYNTPSNDAVSALVNLGYARADAYGAVAAATKKLGDGAKLEALISRRVERARGMSDAARIVDPARDGNDIDSVIRPQTLAEFVGQAQVRENLAVFVQAARAREEALDHVLLHGPPGLGKTTLAQIVSRELGVGFRATSGPILMKAGDLAAILTNLQPRDVLFIDEIHRLLPRSRKFCIRRWKISSST